jgi:CCR4-NOT transcription complex subunit 2
MVSLLGNNYSNSLGNVSQVPSVSGNGQLTSMGLVNDGTSNDGAPFDLNDFPQLSTRPSSAGSQGSLGECVFLCGISVCNVIP